MKKIVSFFGEHSEAFDLLNGRAKSYAEKSGMDYVWVPQTPFDREDVVRRLQDADAGIIDVEPYGEDIFKEIYGSTGILVRFGVGYDKVDLEAAARYGIAIARTAGANTTAVAEMALTLILAARRELKANMEQVGAGRWKKNVVNETAGSVVGILGFGAIGQALAGLLKGFNCDIITYDPYPDEKAVKRHNVRLVGLDELFTTADTVSIHVPYSAGTHHFVNAERLAQMKPTSVIVNTARGNIVDEKALYDALAGRRIRGAALDVLSAEPLPVDSPLLSLDNIILTPHVSSQTMESLWRIYKMAVDIAADFFSGNDSPHILNPEYKSGMRHRA
jgi:phosphoglycerate dehydrogenase-like enzyme